MSLQDFIDSANSPVLLLDFRLPYYLDDPSKATISDATISKNGVCEHEKFKGSVESLLKTKLGNGRLNPRLQARDTIIGAHTEKHVTERDVWTCSGVGPYRIWSLQPEAVPEENANAQNNGLTETRQDDASRNGETIEESSREQQLFNKLDHIHGPLKTFYHLADQALSDVQKAIKDLPNPSLPQDIASHLHPIELNLRTLSSGLSLLKDLSDVSSFTPQQPELPESPAPREPQSNQALLSKILSRVHRPPEQTYNLLRDYIAPPKLEAYVPTLRVLIIEDNIVNSKILTKVISRLGIMPEYLTAAFNGAEGLDAIEMMVKMGNFPDIIFVDFAMPVMGGLEFLEQFRARWPHSRARIIGTTAHHFARDQDRMQKLGAHTMIEKPIRGRIVRDEIEKAATLKMTREIEFRGKL
ncbi:hypothetical protein TWF718_005838 [Orbilia javanica]|uniref:Response regulatory domain-containing protein n=1 Tax=Orbilia javanica TaxID=47235 RepID=A0AAN8MVI0_9PEZI